MQQTDEHDDNNDNNEDGLASLLAEVLPHKDETKRSKWLNVLLDNEFETVEELQALDNDGWQMLPIPVAVKAALKKQLITNAEQSNASFVAPPPPAPEERPVTQIDCIVMDVSMSMRARSPLDVDKTREDVSKVLFHTLMDKLISLELSHAVGLLAFGEHVSPVGITREYERFHDELGRLDANQGRTRLYDAIFSAAEMVDSFSKVHVANADGDKAKVAKRIFVLTDGEDNASSQSAWQVAQFLQQRNVVLDAVPLAGASDTLHAMCRASGGLCFDAVTQEQAMQLFEREATLHLAYREAPAVIPPAVVDLGVLVRLEEEARASGRTTTIRSALPSAVYAPVLSASQLAQKVATASASASASSSSSSSSASSAGGRAGGGRMKRLLKEHADACKTFGAAAGDPERAVSWEVFVTSADEQLSSWKALLHFKDKENTNSSLQQAKRSDAHAAYMGGTWLLSVEFPQEYPFRPPQVRFVTPVYHCNVSDDGRICLDVLKEQWSPALSISKLLLAIEQLLVDPNPDDPLDCTKAQVLRDDRAKYMAEARKHTQQHAAAPRSELVQAYSLGA